MGGVKTLNIVIPMAGLGSRFAVAGYTLPKPLIEIHGIPMIRWVIANLTPAVPHKFIFVAQNRHISKYDLEVKLNQWAPGSELLGLDEPTDGAARTVLVARDFIENGDPLLIANSDQWVQANINDFVLEMTSQSIDGLIMTMKADDPKWSFIAKDSLGFVTNVVEKEVISDDATVGIYGFSRGSDFVSAARQMIEEKSIVRGEYFVAPVYNSLIARESRFRNFEIGSEGSGMFGLGIPSDLKAFESLPLSLVLRGELWR